MSFSSLRVALAGVGGYAQSHLAILTSLQAAGYCRIVGVADPYAARHPNTVQTLRALGTRIFDSLDELLSEVEADAVFLATPIHLHEQQTIAALEAGCHVYVEKPPCATLAAWERMKAAQDKAGRVCAVGFCLQSIPAMQFLRSELAAGAIGRVRRVWSGVRWQRMDAYYQRSPWAGRWHLDGEPVFDGPATNALAHAVQAALSLASGRVRTMPEIQRARGALWRARPVQSYDTAYLEVETTDEVQVRLAFTHASALHDEAMVKIEGDGGSAALSWGGGVWLQPGGEERREYKFGQQPMLSAVLDFLGAVGEPGREPLVPLQQTLPFMQAVGSALQSSRGATDFPSEQVSYVGNHYEVMGLDKEIEKFQNDFHQPPPCLMALDNEWIEPAQLQSRLPVFAA